MAMYADAVMNLVDPATPCRVSGAVSLEVGWGIVNAFKALNAVSVVTMQRDWQAVGAAVGNASLAGVTVGNFGYAYGPLYPTFASAINKGRPTKDVTASNIFTYQQVDTAAVGGGTPATAVFGSYNKVALAVQPSTFGPTTDARSGNYYFDGRGVFGTRFSGCTGTAAVPAAPVMALTPLTGFGTGYETQLLVGDGATLYTSGTIDLGALPINGTFALKLFTFAFTTGAGAGVPITITTPLSGVAGAAGRVRVILSHMCNGLASTAAVTASAVNQGTIILTTSSLAAAGTTLVSLVLRFAYGGEFGAELLTLEAFYTCSAGAATTVAPAVTYAA